LKEKTNVLSGKLSFNSSSAASAVHNGIIYSKSNTSKTLRAFSKGNFIGFRNLVEKLTKNKNKK
jgi:hypothetical protein